LVLLKRILIFVMVAVVIVFAIQNQVSLGQRVDFRFLKFSASLVLGIWLILGFIVGALLFLIIDIPSTLALKRSLSRKTEEAAKLQLELTRLKSAAPVANPSQPSNPDSEKRPGP
jgi:uncharacterized integral membrane protein